MKNMTRLALVVAACATLGTTAALADSNQLQNTLLMDRQFAASHQRPLTVAVFDGHCGVGKDIVKSNRTERRHQLRYDAHGNTSGVYVPFCY